MVGWLIRETSYDCIWIFWQPASQSSLVGMVFFEIRICCVFDVGMSFLLTTKRQEKLLNDFACGCKPLRMPRGKGLHSPLPWRQSQPNLYSFAVAVDTLWRRRNVAILKREKKEEAEHTIDCDTARQLWERVRCAIYAKYMRVKANLLLRFNLPYTGKLLDWWTI